LVNGSPPFVECPINIESWAGRQVQWVKGGYFQDFSLKATYEPIQRRPNTAARISPTFVETDEGWWEQMVGGFTPDYRRVSEREAAKYEEENGPFLVEHRIRVDASAEIEVFPAVFEQHQLCIKSEKRWARTPVEATAYVLLHELAHLDSEMAARVKQVHGTWLYKDIDGSEDGAWQYAQSVMRCTHHEPRVIPGAFSH
jgi:hypothetical protein